MKRAIATALTVAMLGLTSTAIAQSELDQMISPMSAPTLFEDPRQLTELRFIYAHHAIQDDFVTTGGDVNIYALQARFKLTDDLSLIATKDGIVDLNPDAVVPSDSGLANIAAGLKYTLLRDNVSTFAAGLRYEAPTGKKAVLQGEGDGLINPFLSGAYTLCGVNLMASTGLQARVDSSDSSFWDLNLHADYPMGSFYPLLELNLIHVYQSGDRLPVADEGQDFFNLGASGSAGKNILTMTAGARYRIDKDWDIGLGYQFPLDRSAGTNIIDWRLYADLSFRFSLT